MTQESQEIRTAVPATGVPAPGGPPVTDVILRLRDEQTTPPRARRRWLIPLLTAAAIVAGGVAATQMVPRSARLAHVSVVPSASGSAIRITNGTIDLARLHARLVALGQGDLLTISGPNAYELNTDLTIGGGADLQIEHAALLLQSDVGRVVHLTVRSGALALDHASLSSWTSAQGVDTDLGNGRASMAATGPGSRLDIHDSVVSGLGDMSATSGVTWRAGARGDVSGSTFVGDYRGAYLYDAGPVSITHSTFTRSLDDGILAVRPAAGTVLDHDVVEENKANGLEIQSARDLVVSNVESRGNAYVGISIRGGSGTVVAHSDIHDNQQQGMLFASTAGGRVVNTRSWANSTGIYVTTAQVTVTGSMLSANVSNGAVVAAESSRVTFTRDRLDHNTAGVLIGGGVVRVSGATIDQNSTGVRLTDPSPQLTLTGSTLSASVKDAVALDSVDGVTMTGNVITDSGDAVFSLPQQGDVSALADGNRIGPRQTLFRRRIA